MLSFVGHERSLSLTEVKKCIVSGLYSLWVKEGVVEVLGAAISASPYPQNVFATELFDLPVISALSKSVEFEIRSVSMSLPRWGGFQRYQWMSRENEEMCETSFYIVSVHVSNDSGRHMSRRTIFSLTH